MRPPEGVHRRHDPLLDEWVLVSPRRLARPWQGEVSAPAPRAPRHDPDCPLCPGATRASGVRNPAYDGVFVFDNDFPALLPGADADQAGEGLLRARSVAGRCRVLCFSPRHDLSLAEADDGVREAVVEAWCVQTAELGRDGHWVQCFENRGAAMGCSNPHPHGQLWALDALPSLVAREQESQRVWQARTGRPLLCELLDTELALGERVVCENEHWAALVPWWARWPFETLLLPRAHRPGLGDLEGAERAALARILGELFRAQDNLFACDFPYSFGWHGLPPDAGRDARAAWQLHAHCYPPLLRSASVRKFMVGFELLAEAQRDLTAEEAAARLREARGPHWRAVADPRTEGKE